MLCNHTANYVGLQRQNSYEVVSILRMKKIKFNKMQTVVYKSS